MALYRYVKAPPMAIAHNPLNIKNLSYIFMALGSGILIWIAWPIFSFSLFTDSVFTKTVTPVSESSVAFAAGPVNDTNPNAWYPMAPQKHVVTPVNTYSLSIEKFKIKNALVAVGGNDLNTSLVHYGGTALPGEYGVTVIFGHSALPQFYSPTDYDSIFSLLPSLKPGDKINITYDGVDYTYDVYDMMTLEPTDLSGLEQRFDDSYLTLVTCVPPGTLWKRLYVKAKLFTSPTP
jgi:sortase A